MKILPVCAALCAALAAGTSFSQSITLMDPMTNNGSFETNPENSGGGKTDFQGTTMAGATSTTGNPIPYWGNSGGAATDTGVDVGTDITEQGTYGAFEQPGTGIFNLVTSRTIVAGDIYTLTFYAHSTNPAADALTLNFYTEAPPTSPTTTPYSFPGAGSVVGTTVLTAPGGAAFVQLTATYTAVAGDAGNDIGIQLQNGGPDYDGIDNFDLTVTPAVPEPSTYVLLFASLGGLIWFHRFRRALS